MTDVLERRDAVAEILRDRGELLVVAGLGGPSWDCAAAGDDPRNFYLWGAMGLAPMVGLGLAISQPRRRVLVVTADGEMLMGIGSLATIAAHRPTNLCLVVLDNETYGETGGQESHTARGVDLAGIARAAGFAEAWTLRDRAELTRLRSSIHEADGPLFASVKVSSAKVPMVLPPRSGSFLHHRFRDAVGAEPR
ncbi:MAG TPA: thiamine pyrophosphate-dependent enzyme [Vicinamibacteria bacterium]|nr:thiamine pyrophosphate-dependent enzyme [Vicinamibacteria bacterium]